MKALFLWPLVVLSAGMASVKAQTAADLNEGLRVVTGSQPGEYTLSWWGAPGRTYFVQQSFDLMTWNYVPIIQSGALDVCGLNFSCTDERQFWRLRYTDEATGGNPEAWDADGDGVGNQTELDLGLDPFDLDSDHDGYPDGSELEHNSDPLNSAAVPNENLASTNDDSKTELPVSLFRQSKSVEDDWYEGYAAPASSVFWNDDDNVGGSEDYQGASPRWQTKLRLLSYPPFTLTSGNWHNASFSAEAVGELRQSTTGGNTVGRASVLYHCVGLVCTPSSAVPYQPWDVYRKFFTYRKTLPNPNVINAPPMFSELDMRPLVIKRVQTMTAAADCLLLEPPMAMSSSAREYLGQITVTPVSSALALDATGQDHAAGQEDLTQQVQWITLPAGGPGVMVALSKTGIPDNLIYKAQGGVTPATSINPVPSSPLYYETYAASTAGDTAALYPALDDGTGTVTISPKPVVKFDVKERRELAVTIQPIGLDQGGGTVLDPQGLPADPAVAKAEIEAYLDSVFGPQCNVYSHVTMRPQVNVAYDVGLGSTPPEDYKGLGATAALDEKLSIVQGLHTDLGKVRESDEEKAIKTAAPPDAGADVTIYWVAAKHINVYAWKTSIRETAFSTPNEFKADDMEVMPVLGWAGKAMDAYRKVESVDARRRAIWISGLSSQDHLNHNATPYHVIAHELAHALGNVVHTIETYGKAGGATSPDPNIPNKALSGFSPYSDNCLRLMSGISNSKRRNGPKQLSKLERDRINNFNYINTP